MLQENLFSSAVSVIECYFKGILLQFWKMKHRYVPAITFLDILRMGKQGSTILSQSMHQLCLHSASLEKALNVMS